MREINLEFLATGKVLAVMGPPLSEEYIAIVNNKEESMSLDSGEFSRLKVSGDISLLHVNNLILKLEELNVKDYSLTFDYEQDKILISLSSKRMRRVLDKSFHKYIEFRKALKVKSGIVLCKNGILTIVKNNSYEHISKFAVIPKLSEVLMNNGR